MSMARKLRCSVSAITAHGGGVYTLDLSPAGLLPGFRPGQFLHLTVDDYDPASFWPESRVFSIASPPQERQRIRICYSVKGRYTTRMEEKLKVGSEVWIKLPYGEFFIDDSADVVLLAGGTGISAFTAFIEGLQPAHPRQVWLVYGARNPGLHLFRDMLERQAAAVANFRALFFAEDPGVRPSPGAASQACGQAAGQSSGAGQERVAAPGDGRAPFTSEPLCLPGRIALDRVWELVPEPARKTFYLSGPPVMLNALAAGLRALTVAPEQIRTDAWE